jgi:hypothetical protein
LPHSPVTDDQIRQYHEKGFVLAKRFFDPEEIDLLRRAAKDDREIDQRSLSAQNGEAHGEFLNFRPRGYQAVSVRTTSPL